MSYSISTLLTRNLQEVFGENDPARRRAAVQELYTEDGVFYDPSKGVYRGRDEIDRIAGEIRATHLDFQYQPIAEPEKTGNGGRVVRDKDSWSGGVLARPLPDGTRICILNSTHGPRRTKMTLMEEIAHIHLRHTPTSLMRLADGLRRREYNKAQEEEAYGVGAAALLPWETFFRAINSGRTIDQLAEKHDLSKQLIQYRIQITGAYKLYQARQRSRN